MALLKHKRNGQELNVFGDQFLFYATSPYTKGKYNILEMTLQEYKKANAHLLIPGNVIVKRGKDFATCKKEHLSQWEAMDYTFVANAVDSAEVKVPDGVEPAKGKLVDAPGFEGMGAGELEKVVNATPSALQILEDASIDPATVTGSGADGRITKADAQAAAEAKKA